MDFVRIAARVAAEPTHFTVFSRLWDPSGQWEDPEFVQNGLQSVDDQYADLEEQGLNVVGFETEEDFSFVVEVPPGFDTSQLDGQPASPGWTPWPDGAPAAKVAWDNYVKWTFDDEGESMAAQLGLP